MRTPQIDTSGTEAAQRAVAAAQQASANLQQNFQKDLRTENVVTVAPAAGAESVADVATTAKRRRVGTGLASQLGVNV
mgnify:CR=1 FL=1